MYDHVVEDLIILRQALRSRNGLMRKEKEATVRNLIEKMNNRWWIYSFSLFRARKNRDAKQ